MMTESGAVNLFIIMNTDRSDKNGTYCFLDLHTKREVFLFNSFVFQGFKEFILQDDQKILNKVLHGIEKVNEKGNKVTLITLKFSMQEYEKIKNKNRLSETTIDLLDLMYKFGKKHNLRNEVIVHLVDDQLQMIERDTCGMYQIYFYVNLFNPLENSSIIIEKILNKPTIEKLLNEILSTDRQENENGREQFAEENYIQ